MSNTRSEQAAVITATMLRDAVVCERRAWLDVHGDTGRRDSVPSFVQLLWSGGVAHERMILERLDGWIIDLRALPSGARQALTLAAMEEGADHVLGAEIVDGDLLGRPDLLSRVDGVWTAGDVKNGTPYMPDGRRLKPEYGVQVAMYARLLGAAGAGDPDRAFIVGADGERADFDLREPWGTTTMALMAEEAITLSRFILAGEAATRAAAAAHCGLCHWRSVCRRELEYRDDLTLIAEIGCKLRAGIETVAATRTELAALDLSALARPGGRTVVPGLGMERLARFRDRARLQLTPGATAYAREPLGLARTPLEWHLDIEADPTRAGGFVYLHGIWQRRLAPDGQASDSFVHFLADGPEGEREAFAAVWTFLHSDPTAFVYYFSPFERTSYRALQRRYPEVCTPEEVEAFFASPRTIDLYTDVVRPLTEWPLGSYGLKPIAKAQGFSWAAEDASGAASIAWWVKYCATGDVTTRDKIVDYNRSDCIASAVVLDALIDLPVRQSPVS